MVERQLAGTGQQEDRVVMMNRGTCWVLICASLVASIAQAQTTIDVAKITCEQFVLMTVAEPEQIAIWLSGYYHGRRNSTTIDVQQLKDYARKAPAPTRPQHRATEREVHPRVFLRRVEREGRLRPAVSADVALAHVAGQSSPMSSHY